MKTGILIACAVILVLLVGCGTTQEYYEPTEMCTCGHINRQHNTDGICLVDTCECTAFFPKSEVGLLWPFF